MRLEQIIADFREEASVLRANGHLGQAQTMERVLDAVSEATLPLLGWISEGEALLRSGRGPDYFRSRRAAWAEEDLAEQLGRGRWRYRRCVVPRRKLPSIVAAEAGREVAS